MGRMENLWALFPILSVIMQIMSSCPGFRELSGSTKQLIDGLVLIPTNRQEVGVENGRMGLANAKEMKDDWRRGRGVCLGLQRGRFSVRSGRPCSQRPYSGLQRNERAGLGSRAQTPPLHCVQAAGLHKGGHSARADE